MTTDAGLVLSADGSFVASAGGTDVNRLLVWRPAMDDHA